MAQAYHAHYNKQVVREGQAYDTTLPDYLNEHFKHSITNAIEACLQTRPKEPVLFLADEIKKLSATQPESGETPEGNYELLFSGGVVCEVQKMKTFSKPIQVNENLPFVMLQSPSCYNIEDTLRTMESRKRATAEGKYSPTIIIVEQPKLPQCVVSVKGIPYKHNLGDKLQYHRRRGNSGAPTPDEGQSYSEKALELLRESIGVKVDDLETMLEQFSSAAGDAVGERHTLLLPAYTTNYLTAFDAISNVFRKAMEPYLVAPKDDQSGSLSKSSICLEEAPCVLFVSYNEVDPTVTWSRVLAAACPYLEHLELKRVQSTRERSLQEKQKYNLQFYLDYWNEVHKRREARDEGRGTKKGINRRKGAKADDSATKRETTNAPTPADQKKKMDARDTRRQKEDSAFLEILKQIRNNAALKVQAVYRGYASRKRNPLPADKYTEKKPIEMPPYSTEVPALVRMCLDRLTTTHGESFDNYPQTSSSEPRRVKVLRPKRTPIVHEDDVDSEAEDWVEEELLIPNVRASQVSPHINPLRRLTEIHAACQCKVVQKAMKLQRQCSGFSLLQRRAYDLIKVVALHLLFVAYTELFHRGLVSGDCLFSDFATNAHSEVLSWMSCPHLASRGYLVKHGLTQSGVDYNKQLTYPRAVYDEVVFATERMLCSIAAIKQSCFASPVHTKEIGKNIFVVPSLLSRTDFLSVLEQLHEGEQVDKPRTVAWWSLCPHPVVYVNGEPFVLLPRENRQIVENRARYDEFVLRRLPRVAVGASTVADVARILLGKPSPDPVETIQTESGVFDGVHESMSRSREEESSPSPLDVPAATDAVSVNQFPNCFQLSLQDEEDYLKKMVLRELQTTDRVHYYTPRSVDDLLDSDKVQSFTIFTEAEDLQECTLSRKDVETQYESNQILDVLSKQPSPVASELSQRLSISKSGRRRSVERDGWQKVLERASAAASHVTSPAESTVLSPKAGSPSRASKLAQNVGSLFSGSAVPLGDTIQTTKDFVRMMSKEPHTHCTLEYHQPCLVDCAGSGWLSQYEKFLETCLVQIKSESTVVFAADQPLYFLYAMSGAILSKAIEDANVDPMGASAPARPRASSKNVQYLLDHNDERLRYFQGFYELVSAAYANVGVNVTECVMEVNALLESCGCTVLETLIRLIEKAEEEPNHVECRRLIVKATQLSEQYCYLILLKVLLSLPFSADVLHKVSKVPLTPFSSFIESTAGAVEWISTINPWAWATERDPDENKLNYSNILRRWDNGEYICFGAI